MTNTPDNNDRHELALEKAARVMVGFTEQSLCCNIGEIFNGPDAGGGFGHHGTWKREISEIIAAYLSEMDAVIMPRELSPDLLEKAFPIPPRATDRPSAVRCHQVAQKFRAEEYDTLVGAAPHHFNQEGK